LYGESIWKSKGAETKYRITLWSELKTKVNVQKLCKVLELLRSTFYCWLQLTERQKDEVEESVKNLCLRHKLLYGYRRVITTLRKMGLCANQKKVTDYETI